jgi:outer membrane protein insertion porin family
VDYAFKMKDPSPDIKHADYQNKFFADKRGVIQLGVTYPF